MWRRYAGVVRSREPGRGDIPFPPFQDVPFPNGAVANRPNANARRYGRDLRCSKSARFLLARPSADGLATYRPVAWLALALEIERHGSADEILQGRLIDLVAFVDVDGAPDIPGEAGVE